VNALLTSQSVFAAAAAIVYQTDVYQTGIAFRKDLGFYNLLFVAAVAFAVNAFASVGISVGCVVLREWHKQGMDLVKLGALDGFFLRDRINQPDMRHLWSVDVFSVAIPGLFGIAWLVVIWILGSPPIAVVMAFCWISAAGIAWPLARLKSRPIRVPEGELVVLLADMEDEGMRRGDVGRVVQTVAQSGERRLLVQFSNGGEQVTEPVVVKEEEVVWIRPRLSDKSYAGAA
jgi:hypothetical protein